MAGERVVSEPVRLTLPWSVLVPVNRRTNPAGWGKMRGRQFLTREYRGAQRTAELLVQSQVRGKRPRFTAPVAMTLRFYEPDRRRRDPSNLLKLVEDALTGVVYDDDSRIHRQTWERAGVDRDNPRVEITVAPIEAARAA